MFNKPFSVQIPVRISVQKLTSLLLLSLLLLSSWSLAPVFAATTEMRTVAFAGDETITLSDKDLTKGKRLFNNACGQCHIGGVSYTNPDVGLKLEELKLATPPRDNVLAIVDYVENPTTYDGSESLVDYHPNTQLTSEYPKLRSLSKDDLKLIAGYILVQANNLPGWGGSKSETHSDLSQYNS